MAKIGKIVGALSAERAEIGEQRRVLRRACDGILPLDVEAAEPLGQVTREIGRGRMAAAAVRISEAVEQCWGRARYGHFKMMRKGVVRVKLPAA